MSSKWVKMTKKMAKITENLSKKKQFFFLPPINKNHILVEKLLTIFCILPLVASTFFVKALSCQKFLPKKWKFSFDFVWKTNKKNKKFALNSSFLKNIFYLRVTYHAMKKKCFWETKKLKQIFCLFFKQSQTKIFTYLVEIPDMTRLWRKM